MIPKLYVSEHLEMVKSGRVSSLEAHSQTDDEFFVFFVRSMCMGFTKVSEMLSIPIRSTAIHDESKTCVYRIRHTLMGVHRLYDSCPWATSNRQYGAVHRQLAKCNRKYAEGNVQ